MGQLGDYAVQPFSKPVRPMNPDTAPDQIRGELNQLAKNLTGHDADASLHVVTATPGSVTTSPVTIAPSPAENAFAIVSGVGGSDAFADLVTWHRAATTAVVITQNTLGTPPARTYAVSSGALRLTMASGTYFIVVTPIPLA